MIGSHFSITVHAFIPVGCRKGITARHPGLPRCTAAHSRPAPAFRAERPASPSSCSHSLTSGTPLSRRMSPHERKASLGRNLLYKRSIQATREYIRTGSLAHSSSLVNQESFSVSNPALLWFYTDPIVKKGYFSSTGWRARLSYVF